MTSRRKIAKAKRPDSAICMASACVLDWIRLSDRVRARIARFDDYLDKSTRDHFLANSGTSVQSSAMKKLGVKLEFPVWTATNSPEVNMN